MYRNIIFVLMYHRHKLLELIHSSVDWTRKYNKFWTEQWHTFLEFVVAQSNSHIHHAGTTFKILIQFLQTYRGPHAT
jgi:hypothetical protein